MLARMIALASFIIIEGGCAKTPVPLANRPCAKDSECVGGQVCDPAAKRCVDVQIGSCTLGTLKDCAYCGNDCTILPQVLAASCEASSGKSTCKILACAAGYVDADSQVGNGCEQPGCIPTADPTERCDRLDNDCNGNIDDEGADGCTTYYRDDDGDGYGVTLDARCLCAPAAPYTASQGGDCDDDTGGCGAACAPGLAERCGDGQDNDCDGVKDENDFVGQSDCTVYYRDLDGDGAGDDAHTACLCSAEAPYTATSGGDCDDDPTSCGNACNPGVSESCDAYDNNCNGEYNEGTTCPLALTRFDTTTSNIGSNDITALAVDASGNLWVGTSQDGGLFYLPFGGTSFATAAGIKQKPVTAVAIDATAKTWVGYVEDNCDAVGGGSCDCGPSRFTFGGAVENLCTDYMSLAPNGVTAFAPDPAGEMYVGTVNDYAILVSGASALACDIDIGGAPTRDMALDTQGAQRRLFVGNGDLLYDCVPNHAGSGPSDTCMDACTTVDLHTGADDDITALAFEANDTGTSLDDYLFVASGTLGLVRWHPADDGRVTLTADVSASDKTNMLTDTRALAYDEAGRKLYTGTAGYGLLIISVPAVGSGNAYSLRSVSVGRGLPSVTVTALALDLPHNVVWIGTDFGLVKGVLQ